MKFTSTMRRNSGMSLVTAIILLLILSALGAFIVSFGTVQQIDSAFDFQGSQAYHAARSGLEYGAFQAINNASCPVSTSVALSAGGQFGAFNTVTVSCSTQGAPLGHNEGAAQNKFLYALTADACNQPAAGGVCPNPAPGANYVERELQLSVINPP
jgi:MSHA biogenesis protein MshP